jgi:hypothetical protein
MPPPAYGRRCCDYSSGSSEECCGREEESRRQGSEEEEEEEEESRECSTAAGGHSSSYCSSSSCSSEDVLLLLEDDDPDEEEQHVAAPTCPCCYSPLAGAAGTGGMRPRRSQDLRRRSARLSQRVAVEDRLRQQLHEEHGGVILKNHGPRGAAGGARRTRPSSANFSFGRYSGGTSSPPLQGSSRYQHSMHHASTISKNGSGRKRPLSAKPTLISSVKGWEEPMTSAARCGSTAEWLRSIVLQRRDETGRSLRQIFRHFDRQNEGRVSALDLQEALSDLGTDLSQAHALHLLRKEVALQDEADSFSFGEFASFVLDPGFAELQGAVCRKLRKASSSRKKLLAAFGSHGGMVCSSARFAQGLHRIGLTPSKEELQRLLMRYELEDGVASCGGFIDMLVRSGSGGGGEDAAAAAEEEEDESHVQGQIQELQERIRELEMMRARRAPARGASATRTTTQGRGASTSRSHRTTRTTRVLRPSCYTPKTSSTSSSATSKNKTRNNILLL